MSDDVRARREALGLSRQQLADAAGTTASGVWSVENGKNPRGGDAVRRHILDYLERREGGQVTAQHADVAARTAPKAGKVAANAEKVREDFAAAHPDWTVSFEWNGLNVNDAVQVSGAPGAFRFVKHVRTDKGKEWVDVTGGRGGKAQSRSFDPSRVSAVRKERRKRGPGEDVDPKSVWKLKMSNVGADEYELSFATYTDAKHQADAHEIPAMSEGQTLTIVNPHGTVMFEYPASDGLSKVAREKLGVDV